MSSGPAFSLLSTATHRPQLHATVYVADGARIIGDVRIAAHASIWFNAVLRGDIHRIRIGTRTNIQDLAVVHVDYNDPCTIGDEVVVGHQATLHGCVVGDGALIGIGARVLSGARVGEGAVVAAGAVVPEGMRVPSRTLVMGLPAKVTRTVRAAELRDHRHNMRAYVQLGHDYQSARS